MLLAISSLELLRMDEQTVSTFLLEDLSRFISPSEHETSTEALFFLATSNGIIKSSIAGYEYATALELITPTNHRSKLNGKTMNVILNQILERWCQTGSHQLIEGYLPSLMSQNISNSFHPDVQNSVERQLNHRFTIRLKLIYLHDQSNYLEGEGRYYNEENSYLNAGLLIQQNLSLSKEQFHDRFRSFYVQ